MSTHFDRARFLVMFVLSTCLAGCLCNSDVPMAAAMSEIGPHTTLAGCETARTAAGACPAPTGPDAACVAYCKSSWYPGGCLARAVKTSSFAGNACFPKQADKQYYFSCVGNATCQCF